MKTSDRQYIGGDWVASTSAESIDVIDSTTEAVIGSVPAGTAADVDDAVIAAQHAFDGWSSTPVDERAKLLTRIADGIAARADELAATISRETGMTKRLSKQVQVGLPINSFKQAALDRRAVRLRGAARDVDHRPRADRRRRMHHPVELPAAPDLRQGRLRDGGRVHRGAQAERGRPARRLRSRRDRRRGGAPGRGLQPRVRHRVRWWVKRSPRTPASTWCRSPGPPAPGGVSLSSPPRRSRRSPSSSAASPPTSCSTISTTPAWQRQCATVSARRSSTPARHARRSPGCSCRDRRLAEAEQAAAAAVEALGRRRPLRRWRSPRSAGVGGPARSCPLATSRRGDRRRCQARHWRPRHARRAGPRLLRSADRVLRGVAGDDDRPGGDLRPGSVDPALRRRGRCGAHRQRRCLRTRRWSVVGRSATRRGGRPSATRRAGRGQRWRLQPQRTVRWLQAIRNGREFGSFGFEEFLEVKSIQH